MRSARPSFSKRSLHCLFNFGGGRPSIAQLPKCCGRKRQQVTDNPVEFFRRQRASNVAARRFRLLLCVHRICTVMRPDSTVMRPDAARSCRMQLSFRPPAAWGRPRFPPVACPAVEAWVVVVGSRPLACRHRLVRPRHALAPDIVPGLPVLHLGFPVLAGPSVPTGRTNCRLVQASSLDPRLVALAKRFRASVCCKHLR